MNLLNFEMFECNFKKLNDIHCEECILKKSCEYLCIEKKLIKAIEKNNAKNQSKRQSD